NTESNASINKFLRPSAERNVPTVGGRHGRARPSPIRNRLRGSRRACAHAGEIRPPARRSRGDRAACQSSRPLALCDRRLRRARGADLGARRQHRGADRRLGDSHRRRCDRHGARLALRHRPALRAATLHAFAQDLHACLLYAGFAWGAGAFLALPAEATGVEALLFVAAPTAAFALLLRERQVALLFVAPAAGLTSLACATRSFVDGARGAAIVLVASAIAAWAINAMARS